MATTVKAEPLIKVQHLKKTYWNGSVAIPAVKGVNLSINEGEFVALMGPSGSGKSTLMNLLAFLDAPTSGSYSFAGVNIDEFDERYLAELRNATIGFVFQQFYLLPRTSALDNVRLPLRYAGVSRKEQISRATSVLERVGLEHRLSHYSNELSGGQQQRVSIARALVNDPKVLFCDEPTGNLDSKTADEIMDILKGLHKEGRTIIMVTHEEDIARSAKRTIHMKDGEII
ncbi:MAG: macrolide ABC transporter ATP-binding protein [Candidatus Kerfeldbacteria bacterium CG15_BIG_FIL_POST_REV_8_21_14_020_45_12]|uniref:Macrolide ABC transporter ATP-binding protein n=1 Tax=Candidatus Kerfeldbacteria bacterium CG15_BIG_FIL_POST_REV_8_21_14_020_45_12 TaxID=2014247 RepID=A0A2M7H553_9BACT|nr:MAG: macrolide ABC transporter ATP-binding protein [Candidatus Kerfeldbacteria bacterium CG15_BIG_FIL_POST_REV_8_21_14_020_45_12]PJA94079.1 MAG: macrolide ABC transporter ATP-binding protein [Candidatus Kerfeldbacteria bacterium CG_4_9_14_3_um_filter_45_8]